MADKEKFFKQIERLRSDSKIIIDRPKGSAHPRYPDYIYKLDYGYLEGTTSQDGDGIDVWIGSGDSEKISGLLIVLDPVKKDSEIKVLLGCSDEEQNIALEQSNRGEMTALLVKNKEVNNG